MWTSQHHRVKEMESLCSLLNMTTAPNYLVVLAETRSRLDVKDLTTMAESVTRDPMEDHCRSNDEQSDHKITANHLVTLEGTIDYITFISGYFHICQALSTKYCKYSQDFSSSK